MPEQMSHSNLKSFDTSKSTLFPKTPLVKELSRRIIDELKGKLELNKEMVEQQVKLYLNANDNLSK